MAKQTYPGLYEPAAFFSELKPFRDKLLQASSRYRPFGPQYHFIAGVVAALDAAAVYFTGNRGFYAVGDSAGVGGGQADIK